MQTMYPGKVNSPATILDGGINDSVTTINIIDGAVFPVSPNLAVIGTGEDSETILYATKVGNQLSNITRGFQGIAKEWITGEAISRLFTEYDYNALKGNIGTIAGRKISDFAEVTSGELSGKISDEIGTGKIVLCEEGEWTPDLSFDNLSVGIVYTTREGLYTRTGRKVTFTGQFSLSSKGTSTGYARIRGLPFTSKDSFGAKSAGSINFGNISFADCFMTLHNRNEDFIYIYQITKAGVPTKLNDTNFTNNSYIIFCGTYFTD